MYNRTYKMMLVALFAALTAVGAFIKIPVPPVPFTLQNFFVVLSALILGPKLASAAQIIYLLIGLSGIPVFAYGGGIQYVINPTFGYLAGFAAFAFTTGMIIKKLKKPTYINYFIASLSGMIISYIIGVAYLYIVYRFISHKDTTVSSVIVNGFLLFLPWDIVKIALASFVGREVVKRLKWAGVGH